MGRWRSWMRAVACGLAGLLAIGLGASRSGAAGKDPPSIPGWQLVVASGQTQARRHVPIACFLLAENESLDATIPAAGLVAGYTGVVGIDAPGKYRFGAVAEGGVAKVQVFGAQGQKLGEVVNAGASGGLFTSWIELRAAPVTVSVVFTRREGTARLQTLWERQGAGETGFAAETIPPSAVSVPRFAVREAEVSDSEMRGRVLLGELNCTACHSAGDRGGQVVTRAEAPLLGNAGVAFSPGFVAAWVRDPQAIKPGCAMPALFGDSVQDRADAESIAQFVLTLEGSKLRSEPRAEPRTVELGRGLYHSIGCVACHGPMESPAKVFAGASGFADTLPDAKPAHPFGRIGGKWKAPALAAFLRDPSTSHPGGRMPSMNLTEGESSAIAAYLVEVCGPGQADLGADPSKAAAGRAAFASRGCAACHQLGEGAPEIASTLKAKPLADVQPDRGCLSGTPGNWPRYTLDAAQRADLAAGIEAVKRVAAVNSPAVAPLDQAERTIASLGCINCHRRHEAGGLVDEYKPYFQSTGGTELGDEGRFAPTLTGVGFKLRTAWLQAVLSEAGRARPYMTMRMPQFGPGPVGELAARFAAMEGVTPDSDLPAPKVTDELMLAGRKLVGDSGMNCISCHAFANKTAGTAGPEMREFVDRIRYEWFCGYILAPGRFKPGTRMSAFYKDGTGAVTDVFAGDPAAQTRALWAYLAAARMAPSPEGLPAGEGMPISIGDRPVVFRTFMKDGGNRGIAVGYPIGIHFAFDATAVRLVDAWQGEFIDATGVWRNRGGDVATGQGQTVWSAPAGQALAVAPTLDVWPAATGAGAGYWFKGYRIEKDGSPTFSYKMNGPGGVPCTIEERFWPRPREGVLLARGFEIEGLEAGAAVWMNAGIGRSALGTMRGGRGEPMVRSDGATWFKFTADGGTLSFTVEITP